MPIPGVEDTPKTPTHLAVKVGYSFRLGLNMQLELLGFKNSLVENVPSFDKASLGLVPVAGMNQALNIHHMIVADWDDAGQLSDCGMHLVRDGLNGFSILGNYGRFQVVRDMLNGTRADHGEETSVLQGNRFVVGTTLPPDVIVL